MYGELEKWRRLFDVRWFGFGCLEGFVAWYNDRPHGALDL